MKRLLLTLLALTVLPFTVGFAQPTVCAFGTVQTSDGFKSVDGGLRLGIITPLDFDRGLFLRIVGGRVNFGDNDITTIQPTAMMNWSLGKKWDLWVTGGVDLYINDSPNEGSDFVGGLGASRVFYASKDGPTFRGWGELSLTDATNQSTGKYGQLNVGITITPPKK